jgi:lipopolysaccharide/colanic/teichoic acid biosynthesis glycosyltransferase
MLIQLPSGRPDQPGQQPGEQPGAGFEAGLRRDLASAPVVSYDAVLGGVMKRALDLTLTLITAPIWLPLLGLAMLWLKLSGRTKMLSATECIGYGGRGFNRLSLQVAKQAVTTARSKWSDAFERLPELLSVVRGDMALVGPRPLSRAELEPLRSARRYYLSARPGVIGVGTLIGSNDPSQYKIYAMSWEVVTDALILWDALRSLWTRQDSFKPSFTRGEPDQSTSGVVVRRAED